MYLYSSDSQQKPDQSKNRDPQFVPGARGRVSVGTQSSKPKTERVWGCGRMMQDEYAAERAYRAVPQLSNS